jgi:hypothetical protein
MGRKGSYLLDGLGLLSRMRFSAGGFRGLTLPDRDVWETGSWPSPALFKTSGRRNQRNQGRINQFPWVAVSVMG